MVTTFNKSDLVAFGNWLLINQEAREASKRKTFQLMGKNSDKDWSEEDIQEHLKLISHADIENWKADIDKKTTRAKFVVDYIEMSEDGHRHIVMSPVLDGSPENESFWKYTPSGQIGIGLSSEAECNFREKQEYYIDFKKA